MLSNRARPPNRPCCSRHATMRWAKAGPMRGRRVISVTRSEEHTSELQSRLHHVCRLLLEKKERVPESAMDAITAVSGSWPAYFALLAEAMIEAGILLGLSREISTTLVEQTIFGTTKQLRD